MNIYIGTDGNGVYHVQVTDEAEEWVYNLDVVDYAALKAARHPSQLTGAPEIGVSRWSGHGHGLQWRVSARWLPLFVLCLLALWMQSMIECRLDGGSLPPGQLTPAVCGPRRPPPELRTSAPCSSPPLAAIAAEGAWQRL